ncbi:MAG: MarR family transcriptional regulator [Lachnospiraceae bacterium]|nr:MarR family transcriptional regulator [Lachnospiraceae bacterium]
MNDKDEVLKLENQLCFLLYACARATTRYYRPYLEEMGLTYTQYLAMLVLWDEKQINLKTLGERLYLDSGTLTPVLKRLEEKGYITRERDTADERNLILHVTDAGIVLKDEVYEIYQRMESWQPLSGEQNKLLKEMFVEALEQYEAKEREKN